MMTYFYIIFGLFVFIYLPIKFYKGIKYVNYCETLDCCEDGDCEICGSEMVWHMPKNNREIFQCEKCGHKISDIKMKRMSEFVIKYEKRHPIKD